MLIIRETASNSKKDLDTPELTSVALHYLTCSAFVSTGKIRIISALPQILLSEIKSETWASEIAQCVEALVTRPNHQSSVAGR